MRKVSLFFLAIWLVSLAAGQTFQQPRTVQAAVCPPVLNSPSLTILYGEVKISGVAAEVGTVVETINPRGDVVGCFSVAETGYYGAMYVFGEDNSTVPATPGMREGEVIAFRINGQPALPSQTMLWTNDRLTHSVNLSRMLLKKLGPANLATGLPLNPSLTWESSSGATSFWLCYDTSNNTTCDNPWFTTDLTTNANLTGLSYSTTYFWQVRAISTAGTINADDGVWWSFTTMANPCPLTWQAGVGVTDQGGLTGTLGIGLGSLATDGIDALCGEALLPPSPPEGIFDARLVLPSGTQESLTDYRASTLGLADWQIKFRPGSGGYPLTFTWNSSALPGGTFYLKDLFGGIIVNVNMKTQSSYILTNTGITALKIEYLSDACISVNVASGWNMVSVPVQAADMKLAVLFPDITPPAYRYTSSYQSVAGLDALETGRGYWMWFAAPHTYSICGRPLTTKDISVNAGWNMIGPFDTNVAVSSIISSAAGILTPPLYQYSTAYSQANTLVPGKGYWAYVTSAGTLHLGGGSLAPMTITTWPPLQIAGLSFQVPVSVSSGEITLELSMGISPGGSTGFDPGMDLLAPPAGPAGTFDSRLSVDGVDYFKDIRGSKPGLKVYTLSYRAQSSGQDIVLRWNEKALTVLADFQMVDLFTGELFNLDMRTTGELIIHPGSILYSGLQVRITTITNGGIYFLPLLSRD